jgi:hypothetical protein
LSDADCTGIQCDIVECEAGTSTRLSGTVYDPAGQLPIYNALVYVPNAPLDPISTGASCDRCDVTASGSPIATALTDATGRFVMENVPAGTEVPLVVQVGKWRRQVTLPNVEPCVDNALTDPNLTRLPQNQSEGHLPKLAVVTGDAEALECLMLRIGVDGEEFTTEDGSGRIHLFVGGDEEGDGAGSDALSSGEALPMATTELWPDADKMLGYDMMLMSCEGSSLTDAKEDYYFNMFQYASLGGKLFLSHMHFNWLAEGPDDFQNTPAHLGHRTESSQDVDHLILLEGIELLDAEYGDILG